MKTVPTFWKRKLLSVWQIVVSKFRLLLKFCWVSSGGKNIVHNGWLWVLGMNLWLAVGGGDKIMADYGWLWVIAAKLRLVVGDCGWSHNLVMPGSNSVILCVIRVIVQLMSKRDTENPGFCYWLVPFNNITINWSQYFKNSWNTSILYYCLHAWGTIQLD